ncbi:MAG: TonB-dependent receptor [Bryobacterales bacterium]|nr:TonB-dependent receptor [Bryobacterales bacterium]
MHSQAMTKQILILLAVFFLGECLLPAQQITGTMVGTITDTSGSVVPDATIRVVNLATNAEREARSDSTGNYSVPFLPSGQYSVSVSMKGFKTQKVDRLPLQVAQTARVDFHLEVGEVVQNVVVSATAVGLQTENASVGTVIDAGKIQDLPLNGRDFVQLAQLIPGAQPGTPGSITVRRGRGSIGQTDSSFGTTGLSVNGIRDTANRYFIDGVESMDGDAFTYAFPPSIDSLEEFKVETSTYSAESGASPGAQVNLITKSGTNDYHFTLWEFNRNDALTDTYDAIGNKSLKSGRLNRNQFGANLGGPVWFPKLYNGKNRTFFFFNWEYGLQALGAVAGYAIVPTDAQRSGDLSGLVDARSGAPITLMDPLGKVPLAGNKIPTSALSPQAMAFLQFEPHGNTRNGPYNFISSPQSPVSTQINYTARVDHNFSSKDSVMGRYVINDTLEKGTPFWGHDQRDNLARTQNVSTAYTRSFSPYLLNLFRVGWNRMNEQEIFGTTNDPAYDVAGKMGIPLASRRPEDYGPPSIAIGGPEGGFSMYNLQRQIGPRARHYGVWQFDDSLSWQRGTHSLRFGAELDSRNYFFTQARNARGSFSFDGTYTGSALADFLLGYVKRANINSTPTRTNMNSWWQAYYVNDEWKVSSNLTLTLGLRYDYFQRWRQDDNKIIDIYQNGFLVTGFVGPNDSPYGRALLAPDKNNFSPRVGFAWRPSMLGETVIRGGYGIYYQMEHPNANFSMVEGFQATAGGSVIGSSSGVPDVFFSNPFQQLVSSGSLNNTTSIDQNERDAYVQQWNFTIQHKLPGGIMLDTGYVGSKGTRLSIAFDEDGMAFNRPIQLVDPRTPGLAPLNDRRPNPNFARIVEGVKTVGDSTYHSLQVRAERRLSRGLTFLTAYTWAKSMSGPHDQGGLIGNGSFIGTPQDYYNFRNERSISGFDQTQRFVETVLYDVPFFKSMHGVGRYILDGWQVSAIITAQSGFPAGVNYGIDTTGTGQNSRADVVLGQKGNLDSGQRTWKRWFNTAAFAPARWGYWGTSTRTGAIRLPGLVNCDFSVNKQLPFGKERVRRAELRAEFFNLNNHFNPAPGSVDRSVRSQTFGAVGGGVQGVTTRIIQLGAKLYF